MYGTPNHSQVDVINIRETMQSTVLTAIDHMEVGSTKRSNLLLAIELVVILIALGNLLRATPVGISLA